VEGEPYLSKLDDNWRASGVLKQVSVFGLDGSEQLQDWILTRLHYVIYDKPVTTKRKKEWRAIMNHQRVFRAAVAYPGDSITHGPESKKDIIKWKKNAPSEVKEVPKYTPRQDPIYLTTRQASANLHIFNT
jgi:hypothetical protein